MNNRIYSLVAPKTIKIVDSKVTESDEIIVRPAFLSICHADQRYYQGARSAEVLAKKLPMALIHEGIGKVIYDPEDEFARDQFVVMIPNTPYETDDIIAENYLRTSKFRASGIDGFMQDLVSIRRDRVVALPDNINRDVASFTEICSVAFHTINRFDRIAHERRNTIGIWGEGNLGFITSLLLKYLMPESKLIIFGVNKQKMKEFTFVDDAYNINEIPEDIHVDHAFECVGSVNSGNAINQIIDPVIHPEGTIAIMGVSENPVPINTRMVLEKGLRIFGSSRSGRKDFTGLLALYQEHPEIPEMMKKVIGDIINVKTVDDMHTAFKIDLENGSRKTVMRWNT